MKKGLFIFFGSIIALASYGQMSILRSVTTPPYFTFKHVPQVAIEEGLEINPTNDSTGNPRIRQYVEYGDGFFSNNFKGDSVVTKLGRDANHDPLIISYRIYAKWPPKTGIEEKTNPVASGDRSDTLQNRLSETGKNIGLVPSINSVMPGDLMVFAIPFVKKGGGPTTIVFLYNKTGKDIFVPMASPEETITWDAANIKAIRYPDGITGEKTQPAPQITVGTVAEKLSGDRYKQIASSYMDMVSITIPEISDGEHNVFVTLRTKTLATLKSTSLAAQNGDAGLGEGTIIETTSFLLGGRTEPSEINSATLGLHLSLESHDPNYVSASPVCFLKKTTEKMTFRVGFRNDGHGSAKKILISPIFKSNGIFKFVDIKITKLMLKGQVSQPAWVDGIDAVAPNTFGIAIPKGDGQTASFSFKNNGDPFLNGIPLSASADDYTGTDNSGYIEFTAMVAAPDEPDSIRFSADIKFDNNDPIATPNVVSIVTKNDCKTDVVPCDSFWCTIKWWMWLLLAVFLLLLILVFKKRS